MMNPSPPTPPGALPDRPIRPVEACPHRDPTGPSCRLVAIALDIDLPGSGLVGRDALKARSLSGWSGLDNFEDAALDWLAAENLDWARRRNLLQRMPRPDVPNLAKLVHADMTAERMAAFGSYPIHAMMTVPQLEELAKLRPELLSELGTQTAVLNYPHLNHTEIFQSVEDFYKRFYFRAPKIAAIVGEMLMSPQMMKRRLREGVEFFRFLRDREVAT